MLDLINANLIVLYNEAVEQYVEMMYTEMVNEMCAYDEMMAYSTQSYDNDAYAYGGK